MKKLLIAACAISVLPFAAKAAKPAGECVDIAGTRYATDCYNSVAASCAITLDSLEKGEVYFNAPGTRYMYAKCLVGTDLSKCVSNNCSGSTYIGINVK